MQASDGRTNPDGMGMETVTVIVSNMDEPGKVTLTTLQPVDGKAITASHTDPDGQITVPKWQWANSDSADGPLPTLKKMPMPEPTRRFRPTRPSSCARR